MFEALSSWASTVHVEPIKTRKTIRLPDQSTGDNVSNIADWVESKKQPADEEIVIRSSKVLSCTSIAALPQDRKGKARLETNIKRLELGPNKM